MVFGKVIKTISKNMTIITIGAAFVLGFIGMSDVKAVLLNPSEDSVALMDTSTWFKKTDSGNAAGEDEGLRIVSEIGLTDEELEALNNRGSDSSAVETDENGNPIDTSDPSDSQGLPSDNGNLETDESGFPINMTSAPDETLDPNLNESVTDITDESTADPSASSETDPKTSETTKETTTTESKETTTVTTEEKETTTEAPADTTAAPQDTEPPETTTEAPPPETTTETPPPETTTEAPPETTTAEPASMGATGGSYDGDWAKTVLSLVNEEREANGLSPLSWSGSLAKAAKTRAAEIVVKWSHTRPDGSEWWTVSDLTYGENLAYGQTSPSEVVEAWMNSAGHKANILGDYSTLGVACYYYDGTYYWVQEFGY